MERRVNIRPLKRFASEKLRRTFLRSILLSENDYLNILEFLAKLDIWLKLLKEERNT